MTKIKARFERIYRKTTTGEGNQQRVTLTQVGVAIASKKGTGFTLFFDESEGLLAQLSLYLAPSRNGNVDVLRICLEGDGPWPNVGVGFREPSGMRELRIEHAEHLSSLGTVRYELHPVWFTKRSADVTAAPIPAAPTVSDASPAMSGVHVF